MKNHQILFNRSEVKLNKQTSSLQSTQFNKGAHVLRFSAEKNFDHRVFQTLKQSLKASNGNWNYFAKDTLK